MLESLHVPSRLWENVSLDFIISVLKMRDLTSMLVVVDRFSKSATFIPTPKQCSVDKITCLFFKNVVKY